MFKIKGKKKKYIETETIISGLIALDLPKDTLLKVLEPENQRKNYVIKSTGDNQKPFITIVSEEGKDNNLLWGNAIQNYKFQVLLEEI